MDEDDPGLIEPNDEFDEDFDGEPLDIDSDEGFDPYAGAQETPYGEELDGGWQDGE